LPFVGINLARAQRGSILCPKEEEKEKEKTELTREIERSSPTFTPNHHRKPLYLPVPLLT